MSLTIENGKPKKITLDGSIVKTISLDSTIVWQYDTTGPILSVTAPISANYAAPTTTTNAQYTVQGTVSDAESGVAKVTVNGKVATISGTSWSCPVALTASTTTTITIVAYDNAGNTTTLVRYVRYVVPVYVFNGAETGGTQAIWTNNTGTTITIYAVVTCSSGDYSSSYIRLGVGTPSDEPSSYPISAKRGNTITGTLTVPHGHSVWKNDYYAGGTIQLYYYN